MERCDKNLRELLRPEKTNGKKTTTERKQQRKLTLDERKKIAKGVRNGILYLDGIGIEHRDVKPENILLKDGVPKLIDYGVVIVMKENISYRKMGYVRRGSKYQFGNNLGKLIFFYEIKGITRE